MDQDMCSMLYLDYFTDYKNVIWSKKKCLKYHVIILNK